MICTDRHAPALSPSRTMVKATPDVYKCRTQIQGGYLLDQNLDIKRLTMQPLYPNAQVSPLLPPKYSYCVSGSALKSGICCVQLKSLSHTFFGSTPAAMPPFQLHCAALSVTHVQ